MNWNHPIVRSTLLLIRMLGICAGLLVLQNKPENAPYMAIILDYPWIYMAALTIDALCVFWRFVSSQHVGTT